MGVAFVFVAGASATTLESIDVVAPPDVKTEDVRSLTGLVLGRDYGGDAGAFKAACDAVRKARPKSQVQCSLITRAGNRGTYAVQVLDAVFVPELPQADCRAVPQDAADAGIRQEYESLDRFRARLLEESTDRRVGREFVNREMQLDYEFPPMHERMKITAEFVRTHREAILRWTSDCDARKKVVALDLMSYLGDPKVVVDVALREAVDMRPEVRNSAIRLLSTFARALDREQRARSVRIACTGIERGGFLDINKSLSLIEALESGGVDRRLELSVACEARIIRFAKESSSPQLGRFAQSVIDIRSKKPIE